MYSLLLPIVPIGCPLHLCDYPALLVANYLQLLLLSNSVLKRLRFGVRGETADGIYSLFSVDNKGKEGMWT